MADDEPTKEELIAWVNNTPEGKAAWLDHEGPYPPRKIEDYLDGYFYKEDIVWGLAMDLNYPIGLQKH